MPSYERCLERGGRCFAHSRSLINKKVYCSNKKIESISLSRGGRDMYQNPWPAHRLRVRKTACWCSSKACHPWENAPRLPVRGLLKTHQTSAGRNASQHPRWVENVCVLIFFEVFRPKKPPLLNPTLSPTLLDNPGIPLNNDGNQSGQGNGDGNNVVQRFG